MHIIENPEKTFNKANLLLSHVYILMPLYSHCHGYILDNTQMFVLFY